MDQKWNADGFPLKRRVRLWLDTEKRLSYRSCPIWIQLNWDESLLNVSEKAGSIVQPVSEEPNVFQECSNSENMPWYRHIFKFQRNRAPRQR